MARTDAAETIPVTAIGAHGGVKTGQDEGVATLHPAYVEYMAQWARARDCCKGRDAVIAKGTEYVPRLKDQKSDDYKAMVRRGSWYGASWRTVSGLSGMMFRKPPKIEAPESIVKMLKEVDMAGTPIKTFCERLANEILEVGRVGVYLDHSPLPAGFRGEPTALQREQLGLRPAMKMYLTESITNWKHRHIGNRTVLSMVVLKERAVAKETEFFQEMKDQWRVLDLDAKGFFRVRVFQKDDRNKDIQIGADVYPMRDSKLMTEIPFYPLNQTGVDIWPYEPPLLDLFDLNLGHFRTSVDYENGCHFTALPTPWIAGYQPGSGDDGEPVETTFQIGVPYAWTFADPQTKVGFLEFVGQGLSSLEKNMASKEAQMAVVGARMVQQQKNAPETFGTTAINRAGENSVLASMAETISTGISMALTAFAEWAGSPGECKVTVNKDFLHVIIDTNMLNALLQALQKGAISFETYFDVLQRGDIQPAEISVEDELARIKKNPELIPDKPVDPPSAGQGKDPTDKPATA